MAACGQGIRPSIHMAIDPCHWPPMARLQLLLPSTLYCISLVLSLSRFTQALPNESQRHFNTAQEPPILHLALDWLTDRFV